MLELDSYHSAWGNPGFSLMCGVVIAACTLSLLLIIPTGIARAKVDSGATLFQGVGAVLMALIGIPLLVGVVFAPRPMTVEGKEYFSPKSLMYSYDQKVDDAIKQKYGLESDGDDSYRKPSEEEGHCYIADWKFLTKDGKAYGDPIVNCLNEEEPQKLGDNK